MGTGQQKREGRGVWAGMWTHGGGQLCGCLGICLLAYFYQRNLGHTPWYPFSRKDTDVLPACDLVPTGESFALEQEDDLELATAGTSQLARFLRTSLQQ